MPGGGLFVRVPDLEHRRFIKRFASNLETKRKTSVAETARQGQRRKTCQIEERSVDSEIFIREPHAGRGITNPGRHGTSSGHHEDIYRVELFQHMTTNLLPYTL